MSKQVPLARRLPFSGTNTWRLTNMKRGSVLLAAMAVLGALLVITGSSAANAATGYSISSGTWNVRSCPATCGVVSTISGSIPDLVCQSSGPAVTVTGFGTSTPAGTAATRAWPGRVPHGRGGAARAGARPGTVPVTTT